MRIAITGIGLISAIGRGCTETLQSLLAERSGIGPMRYLNSVHRHLPVGEVPYSDAQLSQLAGVGEETLPRTALLGIIAAREALQTAGVEVSDPSPLAFISGTTVGGIDLTEQHWQDYAQGLSSETVRLHEAGETTRAIANHLTPFAFVATPSTACSSALNAIMLGADMLRTGQVKRAVVGGAESLSRFHLNGFHTLMILDEEPCRPFDVHRNGLNLGEGAGYLVLEPEEEAVRRGAKIWGYIGGYANACDAFHQTASSDNGEGAFLAMQGAIRMAGLQPADIDYVNAHGTATPNNDLSESAALVRLFGDNIPAVSSTKGLTGHTTSASGGIEAAICVMAMQQGFVPANVGWHESGEGLIRPVAHTLHRTLQHVLCNAFGFGGNESSLVLSSHAIHLSEAPLIPLPEAPILPLPNAPMGYASMLTTSAARRLTPQLRRLVAVADQALHESGIAQPDAIICATQWGCMAQTMLFLQQMLASGEQGLKPTPFIQSTHNTPASLIAILTGNHGYNCTYSQGAQSLDCALMDVRCRMSLGRIRSALVLEFDEQVDAWDSVLAHIGEQTHDIAKATVYTNHT